MESACFAGGASDPGANRDEEAAASRRRARRTRRVPRCRQRGGRRINLGVGGADVSIDLPDGLGLEDLCPQLIGQGASVGTLLEAGCTPPEQPDGTIPDDGRRHRRRAA